MVKFYGSEKQVKWASSIYNNFAEWYGEQNLPPIENASFWIEHRGCSLEELLRSSIKPQLILSASFPHINKNNAIKCLEQLSKYNVVICDTETTGLGKGHEIIDIALVDIDGNTLFQSYVKPYTAKISDKAASIHRLTAEKLSDSPHFSDIWSTIESILEDKVLVTYNANFDIPMIRRSIQACGDRAPNIEAVCLMKLVQAYFELEDPLKLSEACKKLDIDISTFGTAHTALADTKAACNVLQYLFSTIGKYYGSYAIPIKEPSICSTCTLFTCDIMVCCNCKDVYCEICWETGVDECGDIVDNKTCINCNGLICWNCPNETYKCYSCDNLLCEECYNKSSDCTYCENTFCCKCADTLTFYDECGCTVCGECEDFHAEEC